VGQRTRGSRHRNAQRQRQRVGAHDIVLHVRQLHGRWVLPRQHGQLSGLLHQRVVHQSDREAARHGDQSTKLVKKKLTETLLKLAATGLATATGSVVFSSNKGSLCTATISHGSAKCSTSKRFAKGSLTVTAKYAGNMFDQAASATSRVSVK